MTQTQVLLTTTLLITLIIATLAQHFWVWGLLFVVWSLQSLATGQAYLIWPVSRHDTPILFFAICTTWLVFGLWEMAYDLAWRFDRSSLFGLNLYPTYFG